MDLEIRVPVYKLYGEREPWLTPEMVHCESIAARSRLHDWHIKPHQHNGLFQILYLGRGQAQVVLDDTHSGMRAGQVLLVPQLCVHGFKFSHNAVGFVLTLAYPLMQRLTRQMSDGLSALRKPSLHKLDGKPQSRYLKTLFSAFDEEYRGVGQSRELLLEHMLGAILIWLAREERLTYPAQRNTDSRGHAHFARFCEMVEERYSRHEAVADYAKAIGITAAHLNVLCRRIADKSALELIHERVLLEVKRKLVYTSMTISEVSYAVGFDDPAYFTRFFKRQTGYGPKEFRVRAESIRQPAAA